MEDLVFSVMITDMGRYYGFIMWKFSERKKNIMNHYRMLHMKFMVVAFMS